MYRAKTSSLLRQHRCHSHSAHSIPNPNRKQKKFYLFLLIKFSTDSTTKCVYFHFPRRALSLSVIIIIHSFNFIVSCVVMCIFLLRASCWVLCLLASSVSCVWVCPYEIRLSIELMDVMTRSAVMPLYVNIGAQCKRIDKMWNYS